MSESFVVRLARATDERGEIAGELEVTRTGERLLFRSSEELVVLLRDSADRAAMSTGIGRDDPAEREIREDP